MATRSTLCLALCIFFSAQISAQNDGRIHLPPLAQQSPDTRNIPVKSADQVDQERAQKLRELRESELRDQTAKLAQLASELRDSLNQANGNVLSIDMIKKAETIEKLAHSVKGKLKSDR